MKNTLSIKIRLVRHGLKPRISIIYSRHFYIVPFCREMVINMYGKFKKIHCKAFGIYKWMYSINSTWN